jgi:hypothetical protein
MEGNNGSGRMPWSTRTIAIGLAAAIVLAGGCAKSDTSGSGGGSAGAPIHVSPATQDGVDCATVSSENPSACDVSSPEVVASPGTDSFAVFYFGQATTLVGRQVSSDSSSSLRVLRTVQSPAGGDVSGVGLYGGLSAIPASGGGYALTTMQFGARQHGYVEETVPFGPASFQMLESDLAPAGRPRAIPSRFEAAQQPAAVAEGADGRFLVAQSSAQGNPMAIHIIDGDGRQLSQSSIPARSAYGGTAGYPVAATYDSADGVFLVAWANGGEGVLLQGLDANGKLRGSPVRVSSDSSGVARIELVYNPQLRKTLIVWATNRESNPHAPAVDGRTVDGLGGGLGPVVDFAGDNGSDSIQAAADGGKFLVSWLGGTNSAVTTSTYDPGTAAGGAAPTPHAVWSVPRTSPGGIGSAASSYVPESIAWDLDPATGKGLAAWSYQDHEILGQFFKLPG